MDINYRIDLYDKVYNILKPYFENNKKKYICLDNNGDISIRKIIKSIKTINSTGKFSDIDTVILKTIDEAISVKKIPITLEEKENIYNTDFAIWRELKNYKLTSKLVKKRICPNLQLYYGYFICNMCEFKNKRLKRGNCLLIFKEYSDTTYHQWILDTIKKDPYKKNSKKKLFWKNIYFQILVVLHTIQKYYYIIHGDLHWDNILINNIKEGKYWLYIINGIKYYIPNMGFQLYITDFGKSINFSKFNLIIKNSYNEYNSLVASLSSSDENTLVCGIDYNITNIYKWLEVKYEYDLSKIFPLEIINMLKDIKFKYRNYLPENVIKLYISYFLNNNIGKNTDNILKKYTSIKDIIIGNIAVYNNMYVCIIDIDRYNVTIITNKNNLKEKKLYFKHLYQIPSQDQLDSDYDIIDIFRI